MLLNKKELLPILDDSTLYVSMVEINSLTVSAPAKVILHGEHSVVYGKVKCREKFTFLTPPFQWY